MKVSKDCQTDIIWNIRSSKYYDQQKCKLATIDNAIEIWNIRISKYYDQQNMQVSKDYQ